MRVGPTTPIVPIVVSPALNGAVMIEASHSPVEGCSAPIVTFNAAGSVLMSCSTASISVSRSSVSNSRRRVSRRICWASSARLETPPTTTWVEPSPCVATRSSSATCSSRSCCSGRLSAASCSRRAWAAV